MNTLAIFVSLSLLACVSHAIETDYCVGDPKLPQGPEGFACKNPANLTVDDFVFTGLRATGNITNILNSAVTTAFVNDFPAFNGLGIAMARLDFNVGGVIALHSHRTSEVIVLIKGSIIAGFIDSNNVVHYKKLKVGDVMIFPQSLLHFQVNVGKTPALAFVALNAANPGFQVTSFALFLGNLPSELVEKTTLLSHQEVTRMKKLFGTA